MNLKRSIQKCVNWVAMMYSCTYHNWICVTTKLLGFLPFPHDLW